jgi:hypothetical protein
VVGENSGRRRLLFRGVYGFLRGVWRAHLFSRLARQYLSQNVRRLEGAHGGWQILTLPTRTPGACAPVYYAYGRGLLGSHDPLVRRIPLRPIAEHVVRKHDLRSPPQPDLGAVQTIVEGTT